jgi:HTH-type transcriptional regulator / antitoxin HigA
MKTKLIKSKQEYRTALKRVEELMDARPGTVEGDELELLAALIDIYEEKHVPVLPPDPIEAIRFRMEQEGLCPSDLVAVFGSRGRVSEVLNRKRPLTLTMIRRLHSIFGIPAEVLLSETKKTRLRTA